ncbi:MAG TPA: DUF3251 domain-containing protein [Stenotrophomonas sp.]|nr:DUF3251 domain-containing protein [Stenotrophomonas sp.]
MDGKVLVALMLALALAGCSGAASGDIEQVRLAEAKSAADVAAVRQESDHLKEQITAMTQQIQTLHTQVSQLQADQAVNEVLRSSDQIAFLRPGNDGYSLVRSDLGVLTVTLDDVQPYANGSRILLKFGNPLATTIDGLKVKLQWGSVTANDVPDPEAMREKELTFSQSLPAGAWTSLPVVLEGVPPAALGYVRVAQVAHTGISLRRQ